MHLKEEYKLTVCNYNQQYHASGLLFHISLAAPLLSINLRSEFLLISTTSFTHFRQTVLVLFNILLKYKEDDEDDDVYLIV